MRRDDIDVVEFGALVERRVRKSRRLEAVRSSALIDTEPDATFDRIASLASHLLKTPYAFVTIVDDTQSFWKACIGVDGNGAEKPGRQNPVEESFCQYVIGLDEALFIDDARCDPRTDTNPSLATMGVVAWAGVPLRDRTGEILGTVCAVDTEPRSWTADDRRVLSDLGEIAADAVFALRVTDEVDRSRALLSTVLDRAPFGFGLLDADLRYEMINDVLAEINGIAAADHLGKELRTLLPDVAATVAPLLQGVLDTGEPATGIEITGSTPARPGVERTWTGNFYRLDAANDRCVALFVEEITERKAARLRAERLASMTEQLAATSTVDDVAAVVGSAFAEYFDAVVAVVALVQPETGDIEILASPFVQQAAAHLKLAITDDTGYGLALRSGQTVVIADSADRLERFGDDMSLGLEASACVPCVAVDGTVVGVMTVAWDHPIDRTSFPMQQLRTVAGLVGNVIERNRLTDERTQLIETLQHELLSAPAPGPGVDVAVRYVPATDALGFGGDWFDVFAIDDDRTALIIGDVVGHDSTAAARMSIARTVVGDVLLLDTPTPVLFERVNTLLASRSSDIMATAIIVIVDVANRTLTSLSAGHPPPFLITPGETTRALSIGLRPPLGVASNQQLEAATTSYEPGSKLILFSDGLVETRGATIDDDLAALRSYLDSTRDIDAETLADKLIGDFAQRTAGFDDIALICAELA